MNVDFAKFLALTAMMSAPLVTACDLTGGNDEDTSTSGAGTGDENATTGAEGTGSTAADGNSAEGSGTAADGESGAVDSTGGTAETGTCCTISDTPGCDVKEIQECVCGEDPFCCATDGAWDEACVGLAVTECAVDCPDVEPPDTGETGGAVDCCIPQEVPGCDDIKLETCVCEMDAFCCGEKDGVWDKACVDLAVNGCFAEC